MTDSPAFVLLASYYTVEEAELARSHLAVDGIAARVDGQHTVGVLPMQAIAFGGVKLLVHPEDLERAREVLALPVAEPDAPADTAPRTVDEGDAWMKRASFSAFLGISGCPAVGTAYAIVLVARYGSLPRSPRGTLHFRLALVFIALALGILVLWRMRGAA